MTGEMERSADGWPTNEYVECDYCAEKATIRQITQSRVHYYCADCWKDHQDTCFDCGAPEDEDHKTFCAFGDGAAE